jgi:hypothetical protein
MSPEDIKNRFSLVNSSSDQIERYAKIADKALELALLINELAPDGREKSLALTGLEEVKDWGLHAIRMERFK